MLQVRIVWNFGEYPFRGTLEELIEETLEDNLRQEKILSLEIQYGDSEEEVTELLEISEGLATDVRDSWFHLYSLGGDQATWVKSFPSLDQANAEVKVLRRALLGTHYQIQKGTGGEVYNLP